MAARRPGAYSRYIPPTKPATESKQHLRFDDVVDPIASEQPPAKKLKPAPEQDSAADVDADHEPHDGGKKKKSKQEKKHRDSLVQNGDVEDAAMSEPPTDEALPDVNVQEPETPILSKPKKEKKKKRKSDTQPEERDSDSEDETRKRHKSVFEKKQKSMKAPEEELPNEAADEDVPMEDAPEPVEAHGLEPLPQPAPVPIDTSEPLYETLPDWLAQPIRVESEARAPFTSFGISPQLGITEEVSRRLAEKGYKEAFAIQTAVVPQLLPHHCRTMHSDVLVSAVTGSGKTLAYAMPMIRDLSHGSRNLTRLRALVVLPTRELVRQAQKVCDECAGIFALDGKMRRVQIGTATGYQSIQEERKMLLEREDRYDPTAYQERLKRLSDRTCYYDDDDDEELIEIRKQEDQKETLPEYVVDYRSKVDILICTPGRLVDHIKYTPGFSLDYVRWLIADEADKLLGQGFQQWLDAVMPRLHEDKLNARNHKQSNLSGVRKVILSATMTRDLDLLGGLRLRRPRLVVLQGSGAGVEYALPSTLR